MLSFESFHRFCVYHYTNAVKDHQRLGQRFVNLFISKQWPELFYERDDAEASKVITTWLIEHNYPVSAAMPPVIDHAFLINQQHRQFEREHINGSSLLPRLSNVKGERGGLCNRSACLAPAAYWYNSSTRLHYCNECARQINLANYQDCLRHDGFRDLCTDVYKDNGICEEI